MSVGLPPPRPACLPLQLVDKAGVFASRPSGCIVHWQVTIARRINVLILETTWVLRNSLLLIYLQNIKMILKIMHQLSEKIPGLRKCKVTKNARKLKKSISL
jgi:hypothetical protein